MKVIFALSDKMHIMIRPLHIGGKGGRLMLESNCHCRNFHMHYLMLLFVYIEHIIVFKHPTPL